MAKMMEVHTDGGSRQRAMELRCTGRAEAPGDKGVPVEGQETGVMRPLYPTTCTLGRSFPARELGRASCTLGKGRHRPRLISLKKCPDFASSSEVPSRLS